MSENNNIQSDLGGGGGGCTPNLRFFYSGVKVLSTDVDKFKKRRWKVFSKRKERDRESYNSTPPECIYMYKVLRIFFIIPGLTHDSGTPPGFELIHRIFVKNKC